MNPTPLDIFSAGSYAFGPIPLSIIVASTLLFVAGIWVWHHGGAGKEQTAYLVLNSLMAGVLLPIGLSLASRDQSLAFYWDRWSWAFACLTPSATWAFEAAYLEHAGMRRWIVPLRFIDVSFLLAVTLGLFVTSLNPWTYSWGTLQRLLPFGTLFIPYYWLVLGSLIVIHRKRRNEQKAGSERRKRYTLTLLAVFFGTLGSLDFLGYLGIPYPPLSYVFFTLWMGLFGYAVARRRLFRVSNSVIAPSIIEAMPGALFVTDIGGEILVTNPYAAKLTGVSGETMRGRRIDAFLPAAGPVFKRLEKKDVIGPLLTDEEAILRDESGKEHAVSLSASAIHGEDWALKGVTFVASNIEKIKEHLDVIERQKSELQSSMLEMEKIQKALVGREMKMIELKKELDGLKGGAS